MRQSQHPGTTRKENPREARTPSHQLLLRAGYIRLTASGIHAVMPYLLRVLTKLEGICRTEWAAASFTELAWPLLHPGSLRDASAAFGKNPEPQEGLFSLEDPAVRDEAEKIYRRLQEEKIDVLFDDRDARAGEKFSDSELIGIPVRLTISRRTLKAGRMEFQPRASRDSEQMRLEDAIRALAG